MKKLLALPLFAAMALSSQNAFGALVLGIQVVGDPSGQYIVFDNGAGDNAGSTTNLINASYSYDGWSFIIGTGSSHNQAAPNLMDLTWTVHYDPTAGASSQTYIWIIDSFSPSLKGFNVQANGNQTSPFGTANIEYCDGTSPDSNQHITCSNGLGDSGPIGTTAINYSGSYLGNGSELILQVVLSANGRGSYNSSGDYFASAVPEPASISLLGAVFLGVAAIARKRRLSRS